MDSVYSINIERAVLSSIFFNPEELEDILGILKPKDFYLPAHKKIFEVMVKLHDEGMPIDEDFIRNKVNSKDVDDSILLEILSANPITNTLAYVREIKDSSVKRELASLATTIKKVAIEDEVSANEALDTIQGELYKISTDSATSELKDMQSITHSTLSYIEKMKKLGNKHLIGETTGFDALDRRTTGFNEGDLVIIAARPAMGKCLAKGTKVVMYDGTLKNVEDVEVGDKLMGDDSTPRNILSITFGIEQMYWVRQNKAVDYRVNESHILSLKRSRTEGKHKRGDILNINVKEFLEKSPKFKSNYKGYKVAVEFEEKELKIEPYFLGLWLGDGSKSKVSIYTKDKEVIDYLEDYSKKLGLELREYITENKCPEYSITNKKQIDGKTTFSLQKLLRDENILNNKHIPQDYLINSTKNRLELLAGLIDSDGYYDKKVNGYEITFKDEDLAQQLKYLCDTLGFRTSIKSKIAKIKKINYEVEVYRVRFYGEIDKIPVKIERKKAKSWTCNRTWNQTGIKIEKDIIDEYFGFEIDGNKLFLLEDMTVTHNTALVLNMALKNVERGKGVIFFSLEMPAEQLMLRMLSVKTSIPLQNLRKGDMDDAQWSNLSSAFDSLNTKKLFVDDGGSVNINQLRARVRKLAQNEDNNIKLVIIDYLQLMQGIGTKDRHQEVSDISRGLKMLARELKIPIIALSQLNRGLESRPDKRPMLSDLRESGAIEQDADIIMFVYRDDVYKERDEARKEKEAKDKGEDYKSKFINKPIEEAEIIIGKQRNGPIGTVKLDFHKNLTKFLDKENEHGAAPIEVIFENVADIEKETNIDIPNIL
ncbi:replicative DNA helicase [Aliarcobacter butzleri]|uniref:Replicative DNA helicase n=1 Tax=Aliarcobacter butzleri TaxID=28197 RepID=A0AAP4PY83_9BACT|nr:replicative DNA helicase [Aliarcobacter butzleri]MCT7586755.1 replicative DNA helicase [Aliarcobacter butzleri]MCT7612973.1 replicative DNA helicase [Aliarcobacter butzleri]MCT7639237.1 replicative DNA helicase [Aliarcobacter butzleri]MCT7641608.1 replicative DNA helicase [Aliarcobacter butzleri]MDK2091346.1 replicative DNA helicase [Aliarcobacter butzleri]